MILPEVVDGLFPEGAVSHLIASRDIVAVGILGEVSFRIVGQVLIERVKLAQTNVPHILVGLDACIDAIGTIHQTHIIVACGDTIPGLSCTLEVTDVLIAEHEIIRCQPGKTSVVGAAAPRGAVNKTVGVRLVVGSVEDEAVPQQTRGELTTDIEGVEGAIRGRHLSPSLLTGCG